MHELVDKIWAKHIRDWLEQSQKAHEFWSEQIAEEKALKLNQQITECREQVEKMTIQEIADVIVTATNENKRLEEQNKNLLEELETLNKIKEIIIDTYNLEDDEW